MRLLRLSGKIQPKDVAALLTAPTGGAAFNIEGMTLHSQRIKGSQCTSDTGQAEHFEDEAVKLAAAHH